MYRNGSLTQRKVSILSILILSLILLSSTAKSQDCCHSLAVLIKLDEEVLFPFEIAELSLVIKDSIHSDTMKCTYKLGRIILSDSDYERFYRYNGESTYMQLNMLCYSRFLNHQELYRIPRLGVDNFKGDYIILGFANYGSPAGKKIFPVGSKGDYICYLSTAGGYMLMPEQKR